MKVLQIAQTACGRPARRLKPLGFDHEGSLRSLGDAQTVIAFTQRIASRSRITVMGTQPAQAGFAIAAQRVYPPGALATRRPRY